jgi:hypothetical protein
MGPNRNVDLEALKDSLRRWVSTLVMLVATLAVIVVGDGLPASPCWRSPNSWSKCPIRARTQSTPPPGESRGWSAHVFYGVTASVGFQDEARRWQLKRVLHNGDWWREPRWRRFTLMMPGATLLFYRLFGLLFIIATPGIKLLVAPVVFGNVRTVWAFKQDRPFREAEKACVYDSRDRPLLPMGRRPCRSTQSVVGGRYIILAPARDPRSNPPHSQFPPRAVPGHRSDRS